MTDPFTIVMNMMLIVGVILLACVGTFVLATMYTTTRSVLWYWRMRRSWKRFQQLHRRADGKRYPNSGEGFCVECNKWSKPLFYPDPGPDLCSPCYEKYWRLTEEFVDVAVSFNPRSLLPHALARIIFRAPRSTLVKRDGAPKKDQLTNPPIRRAP